LLDLENNIALHPKAQCSKCSFQIKWILWVQISNF
jgi:hypothetical protein